MADQGASGDSASPVHDKVKEFYGKRIQTSEDLMTNCCTVDRDAFTTEAKEALKQIHPDVLSKNYGCGAVYPEAVEGCTVLDLGSGAGIDCFVMSKLVGPKGHVTGIDMTKEQLDVARRYVDYHTQAFAYAEPNVEFVEGFIEKLEEAGLKDGTFDVVISNCVVNLSPDKEAVLKEAYRVLKVGGEMYFSDIYSNQEVPESLKQDKTLWGECLSGAMQWSDLVRLATEIGFAPPVLVSSTLYTSGDAQMKEMLDSSGCPDLKFCSATYRLMKVDWKKPEEAAPMRVEYKGTVQGHQSRIKFSYHGPLQVNTPVTLPSSVTSLLQNCPRLSPHFTFTPTTADEEQTTPLTPPLAEFVNINPFEVSSRTKELGPPKSHTTAEEGGNDGCCEPPAAKRPCCESGTAVEGGRGTAAENGSGTCCAAACGDTCGTEKSCC